MLSVEALAAGDVGAVELLAAGERAHGEDAEQGESGGRHGPTLRAL